MNLDRGETMLTCLGCYTIMFAQFVFGSKPEDFSYTGGRNAKGADSWTNLHLKFGQNRDAILLCKKRAVNFKISSIKLMSATSYQTTDLLVLSTEQLKFMEIFGVQLR